MKIFGLIVMKRKDHQKFSEAMVYAGQQAAISEIVSLKEINLRLEKQIAEMPERITKLKTEIGMLESKVRQQTEADLLLVSLKIIKESLAPMPRQSYLYDLQQQQMALQNQYAQMQGVASSIPMYGISGLQQVLGRFI